MRALRRFLRFLLRIQGVVIEGMESHDFPDSVSMQIRRRGNAKPRCPECRRVLGGRLATRRRSWRHLDLFRVKCYLVADLREGTCPRHGRRVERVPWAAPAGRHTHEFDRQVASLV